MSKTNKERWEIQGNRLSWTLFHVAADGKTTHRGTFIVRSTAEARKKLEEDKAKEQSKKMVEIS